MSLRIIFLAYALGSLLLIAACGGGGGDAGECDFGGPYPFGGPTPFEMTDKQKDKKQDDFERYERRKLFLSQTTKLQDMDAFEKSIRENLPFPYGVRRQAYNYVVAENCDILVAEWKDDLKFEDVLSGAGCFETPRDFTPGDGQEGMINWFPEELNGSQYVVTPEARKSPCWLDAAKKEGILDAFSKHFMLAQESRGEGEGKIEQYNKEAWANTSVAYAGEILVDLGSCTYSLNSNSGTYRPPDKHLPAVTKYFLENFGRDSLKISNVEPWC